MLKSHLITLGSGGDIECKAVPFEDGGGNLEDCPLNFIQDCIRPFVNDLPGIEVQVQGCHSPAEV